MKTYFIRLFNYNLFANKQIAACIAEKGIKGKPIMLMAHLLAAEQIWLKRCVNLPAPGGPLWPNWDIKVIDELIVENHNNWINYLNQLQPQDFERTVIYKNSTGISFETPVYEIITQVINHGTHTRAQAGQYLKINETDKLPVTDYIYYSRLLNTTQ